MAAFRARGSLAIVRDSFFKNAMLIYFGISQTLRKTKCTGRSARSRFNTWIRGAGETGGLCAELWSGAPQRRAAARGWRNRGNVACYFYDPDYNNIEFCAAMDTIENYRARYGDTTGSSRA
jgi:hypothetical protein